MADKNALARLCTEESDQRHGSHRMTQAIVLPVHDTQLYIMAVCLAVQVLAHDVAFVEIAVEQREIVRQVARLVSPAAARCAQLMHVCERRVA